MEKTMTHSHFRGVLDPWTLKNPFKGKGEVTAYIVGTKVDEKSFWADQRGRIPGWQIRQGQKGKSGILSLSLSSGQAYLVRAYALEPLVDNGHRGVLGISDYTVARDIVGQWIGDLKVNTLKSLTVNLLGMNGEQCLGAVVGLNLAAYQFKEAAKGHFVPSCKIEIKNEGRRLDPAIREAGESIAASVNLARHLTNIPANWVHPASFARMIQTLFSSKRHFKATLWQGAMLAKQRMRLLQAVGGGSEFPPCLLHLSYRPSNSKSGRQRPIAFVGKGITFDSGGLNIKPSSGMRLMKKDMAGAAALAGLALWVSRSDYDIPCDFYFALAENSISGQAYRPGDIIEARNGLSVEIHNTDAEGRLVLADALDVATKQASKPQLVIDVATLTGAMKVALGSGVAGIFGTDDELVAAFERAASNRGDWFWGMPLIEKYKSQLKSQGADLVNSSDGFAGAITAALFLQHFVGEIPWLHLDIYGWKDSADGAIIEPGASGQAVQALIEFMRQQ